MEAKGNKVVVEPIPIERAMEEVYKLGIWTVVEWINGRSILGNIQTHNGKEWQAKLKEWGIDDA